MYGWTDVCVRVDGWMCERTYVRKHVHSSLARARTKIRSTRVDLISVRLVFFFTYLVLETSDVQK